MSSRAEGFLRKLAKWTCRGLDGLRQAATTLASTSNPAAAWVRGPVDLCAFLRFAPAGRRSYRVGCLRLYRFRFPSRLILSSVGRLTLSLYVSAFPNGSLVDQRGRSPVLGTRCELPPKVRRSDQRQRQVTDGLPAVVLVSARHTRAVPQRGGGSVAIQSLLAFLWSDWHLTSRDIVPAAIDRGREPPTPRALGPLSNADVNCRMFTDTNSKSAPRWNRDPQQTDGSRTVLITGGTGGIDRATALGLATMGAHLAITGRDRGRTEGAAREIRATGGGRVDVFVVDLSSQSEVRRLAEEVL